MSVIIASSRINSVDMIAKATCVQEKAEVCAVGGMGMYSIFMCACVCVSLCVIQTQQAEKQTAFH